jgi:hypothetical protein
MRKTILNLDDRTRFFVDSYMVGLPSSASFVPLVYLLCQIQTTTHHTRLNLKRLVAPTNLDHTRRPDLADSREWEMMSQGDAADGDVRDWQDRIESGLSEADTGMIIIKGSSRGHSAAHSFI